MSIRNCSKCGKIFNYVVGKPICPSCRKTLEESFQETRLFIKRNPKASIAEVSEECDVDVKQIKQWVRDERLSFLENSEVGIDCEICGKNIRTGRFCNKCKNSMTNDFNQIYEKEEKLKENPFARKNDAKMRYMDKMNK